MEEFDSFEEFDQQVEAENAHNNRFQNLLMPKDGDQIVFRLLKEALPFQGMKYHYHFDKANRANGFHALCATEIGQSCYYCKQYDLTGEKRFKYLRAIIYPVFIQDWQNPRATADGREYLEKQVGQRKLWIIKGHSKQTDHHKVRDFCKRYGTALNAEWQYSRRGSDKNTTYSLAGYQSEPNTLPLMSTEEVRELVITTIPPKIDEAEESAA